MIYAVAPHEPTRSMITPFMYGQYANALPEMKYGNDTARMEADIRARQIMLYSYPAKMKKADPSNILDWATWPL